MKRIVLSLFLLCPALLLAQGQKGKMDECAPMKKGKVCYVDEIEMDNVTKEELYSAINSWAVKEYGKDVFGSNLVSRRKEYSVHISSKYNLLLNDTDSTEIRFKMNIKCYDNKYVAEMSDIVYIYDPENRRKYKTYKAEDVIADNGKNNKIAVITDPELFCNATFFFANDILGNVLTAANEAE